MPFRKNSEVCIKYVQSCVNVRTFAPELLPIANGKKRTLAAQPDAF